MNWLLGIVAQFRSQLFALVGVLAVCGVGAAVISYIHIASQRETIDAQEGVIQLQAATNQQWSQNWQDMKEIRKVDQQAVTDLQAAVGLIAEDNEEMAQAVKRLEANDEIVKKYMAQPIPPELRRVLQQK